MQFYMLNALLFIASNVSFYMLYIHIIHYNITLYIYDKKIYKSFHLYFQYNLFFKYYFFIIYFVVKDV